jgi:predicted amidohydrolase YtcJ
MLIIYNAHIHTLDVLHPISTAIAIDQGRVMGTGNDDALLTSFSNAELVNANGRSIIPGLTDAHIHLEEYALALQKEDCETHTRNECLRRVAERVIATPPGEWILGHGWNQNGWSEGYGNADMLDEIAPQNPVYLTHKSLHSAWANSMALHIADIRRGTPDPLGGRIGRLANGEPDGILFESATELVETAIPSPSLEKVEKALEGAIQQLWQMGLTGGHDFDHRQCFSAMQQLHQEEKLRFRVVKAIHQEDLPHATELGLRSGFGDDMLRIGSLKLFSDGALGPQTAAMLEAYEDDPQNFGMLNMDEQEIVALGRSAVENGISMAVHAIGDLANRTVLNAYAQLREYEHSLPATNEQFLRHRIEHVQIIHPSDVPRFAQNKIIASMQPIHATSDMFMADRHWGKRSTYAYAWRSILAHQIPLIFGSDAPVESPNPFWGIHAAVTRQRADGSPAPQGWYPEQRLSVDETIRAYTTGPAYASGMPDRCGILAPGFLADLLILDKDPYNCAPEEILNIHPIATMIAGEWVYSQLE